MATVINKVKEWGTIISGCIVPVHRDQTRVPVNHREVNSLCKHNRTTRMGIKPDTGNPGKPKGW
jgi:hypothetical protein